MQRMPTIEADIAATIIDAGPTDGPTTPEADRE